MQPHPLFASFIEASYKNKLRRCAKEAPATVVVRNGLVEA
jgi:hypothetical protein